METRASYVAVGAFVLVLVFALVGFVLWLGGSELDEDLQRYRVYFTGSVTGLNVGSTVRFLGVPVGTVEAIAIDPDNPGRIPVTIDILRETPVTVDSVATLEMESFVTGVLYVQISGGEPDSPRLPIPEDPDVLPIIPSRASSIQTVLASLPEILDRVSAILESANQLLSEDTQRRIAGILENVQTLTGTLADQSTNLAGITESSQALISDLDGLVMELRVDSARLSDRIDTTLATIDTQAGTLSNELSSTAAEVRTMAGAFTEAGNQVAGLIEGMRPGLQDFSQTGLYEFTLMVSELRGLAQTLSRVTVLLEQDPTQLIFGRSDQGVPVE